MSRCCIGYQTLLIGYMSFLKPLRTSFLTLSNFFTFFREEIYSDDFLPIFKSPSSLNRSLC